MKVKVFKYKGQAINYYNKARQNKAIKYIGIYRDSNGNNIVEYSYR